MSAKVKVDVAKSAEAEAWVDAVLHEIKANEEVQQKPQIQRVSGAAER
jgi:hypothetical protein